MATVRDIITDALREIGVLASSETPTADDATFALNAFNRQIDANAAESLLIFTNTRTTCPMVVAQQNYSVGAGGDINIPWPVFPQHIHFQDTAFTPSREWPLQLLTNDAWANVTIKSLTSTTYPVWAYYNATYPLGTIQLWPIPQKTGLELVFYAPQQVSEFADLNSAISLPPGWRRFLTKNLALELCPSYERPASEELKDAARESKAVVKRSNIQQQDMKMDAGALCQGSGAANGYWIYTG